MSWTNAMVVYLPNPPQTHSEMTRHLLSKSGEKMHFDQNARIHLINLEI